MAAMVKPHNEEAGSQCAEVWFPHLDRAAEGTGQDEHLSGGRAMGVVM
jgi:hypothetical protein